MPTAAREKAWRIYDVDENDMDHALNQLNIELDTAARWFQEPVQSFIRLPALLEALFDGHIMKVHVPLAGGMTIKLEISMSDEDE